MDKHELEKRTKDFAIRIIRFVAGLPKNPITDIVGYQLVKAGTSVGANYREANRAESRRDFIHKIAIVEKEASESQYWLELINESQEWIARNTPSRQFSSEDMEMLDWLLKECSELLAIFTSIGKTTKKNQRSD